MGCGGKGMVLVELGGAVGVGGAGGADLKCGEIYGLSKEKRKMLMLAAEHAESAPPLVFGEKSRGGPAAGGSGELRGAATFPGGWATTSLSGRQKPSRRR